jgi:hypothetical protein
MDQLVRQRQQQYQASPQVRAHPTASGIGEAAGTIAATAPLAALPGGGATLLGRLGMGAVGGAAGAATQPVTEKGDYWSQKGKDVALGGALGAGSTAAGRVIGAAAAPLLRGDAATLAAKGTQLAPGQMVGGALGPAARSIEAKLQSFPILGDFIQHARGQSLKSYNIATINQVLEPIGASLPGKTEAGHQAIKIAGNAVSKAYDDVLSRIPTVVADRDLRNAVSAVELEARQRPAVWRTLRGEISGLTQKLKRGPMTGREVKLATSELERVARGLQNSDDFFQREVARHLRDVRGAFSDAIDRQYPDIAPDLRNADAAWAMLTRVENAATRRAGSQGIFTPMDLLTASRSGAGGVRRRVFANGDALMQDWAEAGQRLLPSMIPDSGTAGRLLMIEQAALGATVGLPTGLAYRALSAAGRSAPGAIRRDIADAARIGGRAAAPAIGATGPQGGTITRREQVP